MERRILLPTDFSKNAQNAMDYAINLYKDEVCEFCILNTYEIEPYTMELTAIRDLKKSKRKSNIGLIHVLKRLLNTNKVTNHKFHIISECGSLISVIKEVVDKRDIDMVIMGTKGGTNSKIEIYGTQTVLAMEKIRNCPVLAVPKKATFKGIKEIIFPTDYKTNFKRREFQHLVDIAEITKSAIRILHISVKDKSLNEDQLNNQILLKSYFERLEYSFHTVNDTEVQKAINVFIKTRDGDMVVFINKKHNFLESILFKPMVKNLGYHSKIPVLALHDLRN
ncbi:universal stress protein [uncultured Polaribacter sp.]|uniref:universal stress protein n=1 Tax=uncultured Polaribacter sp. TaxID=174711 RepID=UPI00260440F9|nr:universal stress protein [uncultured Polaribacter sp.]